MPPGFEELLTDDQLRNATSDQINDLLTRIDMMLQRRGEPGIVRRSPKDHLEPSDPADPGTIGSE
jgi:hypothetical protein